MDYDFVIRSLAVVAAVALLAGPRLVAAAKTIKAPIAGRPLTDAHTVLEIASRLQAAGNMRGVELCQSLIDVMLTPEKKA